MKRKRGFVWGRSLKWPAPLQWLAGLIVTAVVIAAVLVYEAHFGWPDALTVIPVDRLSVPLIP